MEVRNEDMDNFRNLFDLQLSSINNSSELPINQEAKKKDWKKYSYNKNKKCVECGKAINNRATRCQNCYNSNFDYKARSQKWLEKSFEKYKDITISADVEQMLLGGLLGDGNLRKQLTTKYRLTHCLEQKDYLLWKKQMIDLPSSKIWTKKNNACAFETNNLPQLNKYYDLFYPNGKKIVTREILDKLNPLGLAVWYMDDGCLRHNSIVFSTQSFNYEQQVLIKEYFKEKLRIDATIDKVNYPDRLKNYFRIIIWKTNPVKKFLKIINLYVVDCMRYKLDFDTKIKEGLEKRRNYKKENKDRIREVDKIWKRNNPEKVKATQQRYKERHLKRG